MPACGSSVFGELMDAGEFTVLAVMQDLYAAATDRIKSEPELAPHADALLAGGDDPAHFVWLLQARTSALIEWAEAVEADRRYRE